MQFSQTYNIIDRPPRKRCIVILMDGTWNDETGKDGDGVVTDVVKLFRCLEADSSTQVVRYFRGVGNDEENGWLGIKRGGAFGRSEKRIRDNAYSTIAKEYHPGDRIFIFGFSRGAASARLLAGQLATLGIPQTIKVHTEPKQNRYTRHIENRFVSYKASGGKLHDVDVEFLGVWDTVGAFGIPVSILGIPFQKLNLFRDMHVAKNVIKAVHLVSIDETRKPFIPTLMNERQGVEEIWLPGVHSDVGGGYKHDQLGRVSLNYMIQTLRQHVATLDGYELRFDDAVVQEAVTDLPDCRFHFHGLGYKKEIREIYVQKDDKRTAIPPKIHSSMSGLRNHREVYSVIRKKRRLIRGVKADRVHIVYNPINVKALEWNYKEVATPHVP